VTERDLDRAEAIAFEVVRARIAGDHGRQERQEGEP
jgi:hypothetical protein